MDVKRTADREWIKAAVDSYERPLTIYAARMLGDLHRARDIVQDTFLKLWQAERATVDGHLAKWLYTVCRNRALDVRRKEHRMTTLAPGNEAGQRPEGVLARIPAKETPDNPGGPEAQLPGAGILAFVGELPDRQQEVVRLKFQGGLSYREIAEVMETTANNVGVLLHTAIKSIRTRLAEAPGESAMR